MVSTVNPGSLRSLDWCAFNPVYCRSGHCEWVMRWCSDRIRYRPLVSPAWAPLSAEQSRGVSEPLLMEPKEPAL